MESALPNLRPLRPFAIAALIIALCESAIWAGGHNGNYNTDFFDFSPLEQDNLQKHTIYDKYVRVLGHVPSDVVQVGDSSGFYGVKPDIVSRSSGGQVSYLNLSCCGDAGWTGYFYEARLALMRETKHPEYLLLHVTPFWSPAAPAFYGENSLATVIHDYLIQDHWWHKIRMPSEGYRLRLINLLYHGRWLDDFAYQERQWPTIGYPPIDEWRRLLAADRGWIPMPVDLKDPWVKGDSPAKCGFDPGYSENGFGGIGHTDTLYEYLKMFAELARASKARFVFVSNPVPCIVQKDSVFDDIERQMTRFKADYPDAVVPFAFLRQAPMTDFSDRYHLKGEGVLKHSAEIGKVFQKLSVDR
jgi:hypothetical protein